MKPKILISPAGFSLIEVLIALSLLSLMSGFFIYFGSINVSRIEAGYHEQCEQVVRASLENIRSIGLEQKVAEANHYDNKITRSYLDGISQSHLWPEGEDPPLYIRNGGSIEHHGHRTIVGSMSALAGLFYSDPQFCESKFGRQYSASSPGSKELLFEPDDSQREGRLKDVQTFLRIEPYDLVAGKTVGCGDVPKDLRPMPVGEEVDPATLQPLAVNTGIVRQPANVSARYGFWVTVTTTYTRPDKLKHSCTGSSLLHYPRIRRPASLDDLDIKFDFFRKNKTAAACEKAAPGGWLTVVPPGGFDKNAGMVLLCRDMSRTDGGFPAPAQCPGGPARAAVGPDTAWKPCETVTVCGQNYSGINKYRTDGYIQMRFDSIPWGCVVRVEARLVDPALNIAEDATTVQQSPSDNGGDGRRCITSCPSGWEPKGGSKGYCSPYTYTTHCKKIPPPPPPPEEKTECKDNNELGMGADCYDDHSNRRDPTSADPAEIGGYGPDGGSDGGSDGADSGGGGGGNVDGADGAR